jgi:hypothetical protein
MAMSHRFLDHYLPGHPDRDGLQARQSEINREIEAQQRALIKPRQFHFVVRPAPNKP